jgi:hypothetical protein
MAGPLDDLVAKILRRVEAFAAEHELGQAMVEAELADGSLLRLATIRSDPGYGFLTLVPHTVQGEPQEVIVPVGAIRQLTLSRTEAESPFGFGAPADG